MLRVSVSALGWVFLISRMVGLGVMIPENAVWAKDLEVCNAIRETVALIVDPGLVVSDCKDETENYLGVPIYLMLGPIPRLR
jgi:hypothetical protein